MILAILFLKIFSIITTIIIIMIIYFRITSTAVVTVRLNIWAFIGFALYALSIYAWFL